MLGSEEVTSSTTAHANSALKNKRKHTRVKPSHGSPIWVDINGENFLDVLHAKDISETGIGIRVPHFFSGCSIDKPVQFIITLPEPFKKAIKARGLVKHSNQDQFGVRFTHIDRDSVGMLREYIAHRMAEEGEWLKSLAFKLRLTI